MTPQKIPEEVRSALGVSRETEDRLEDFIGVLTDWNARINLIAPGEVSALWTRHVLDSAQLVRHAPPNPGQWLDLGSGGGFPGLICAILLSGTGASTRVSLVEADTRKAIFLRQAAHQIDIPVEIHATRAENLTLPPQDVISARAFAPLPRLFAYAEPFITRDTVLLLHKGRKALGELTAAAADWHSQTEILGSVSDPSGVILRITELQRNP